MVIAGNLHPTFNNFSYFCTDACNIKILVVKIEMYVLLLLFRWYHFSPGLVTIFWADGSKTVKLILTTLLHLFLG